MKVRNKITGEVREIKEIIVDGLFRVNSLKELSEYWEDYGESGKYWAIDQYIQAVDDFYDTGDEIDEFNKDIGNYFETKEEAEKAVEKLKAWKRLKDKRFINEQVFSMNLNWCNPDDDDWKAFHLLFGGEK